MSIEGLVLQYYSPHNIHNTKINSIMHNQVTLKINYTNNDFFLVTNRILVLLRDIVLIPNKIKKLYSTKKVIDKNLMLSAQTLILLE